MKLLRILAALLLLLLLSAPALAEDVCVVDDASAASHITTDASYLRVGCPLSGSVQVWAIHGDSPDIRPLQGDISPDGRTVTLTLPGYCAAMVVVQGAP